jgi:hypothetical protein
MIEVTKEQIYNAMLMPGEYTEKDGKFYIKPGMLDGYIETNYFKHNNKIIKLEEEWVNRVKQDLAQGN